MYSPLAPRLAKVPSSRRPYPLHQKGSQQSSAVQDEGVKHGPYKGQTHRRHLNLASWLLIALL